MITLFRHHGRNCEPEFLTIQDALSRIKRGVSKSALEKVRLEKDKTKRDNLKLTTLPMLIFQGKFTSRHNSSMVEPSGFMIADFDKFPNQATLESEKSKIKADKYTYSCFVSPSGNGLKVLVQIPKCKTNEEYNQRFDALNLYWSTKSKYWDKNNKGWVRTCFESFDNNIYINEDSEVFEEILIPEKKEFKPQKGEEITSSSETFRLLTERECKDLNFAEGGRNNALYFLACRCNDYSIPKFEAESMIKSYISGCGLPESEMNASINSAYRNPSMGKSYVRKYEPMVKKPEKVDIYMPNIQDDGNVTFWEYSTRGALKLNFYNTKSFLQKEGFFRYEIDTNKFIFIKVVNNIVEEVDLRHIKDFILEYLETIGELDVYNMVAENSKFKKEYINCISAKNINWCKDEIDKGFLFYKNCFVEVNKLAFVKRDYKELPGCIWKKQIIQRDFDLVKFEDYDNCDVSKFSKLVSDNKPDRLQAYVASMGYLMHGFKTYENAKAVIYNDEVLSIDGEPMGRSGKGLTLKFVNAVRLCVTLPGKSFDFHKETSLQRVGQDTQVVFIDDVNKSFDFENLFNWITEGIIVRKLYAGEVWIPFEDAPKFALTTNYTIKGDNNSHDDRRFEIEIHPYFNPKRRPSDEFGRAPFTGWDEKEWLNFDNFMCFAMQLYLKEGLKKPEYVNLKLKKLVYKTNSEFIEWAKENIKSGERIEKKEYYNKIKKDLEDDPFYKSQAFTPHRFNGWLKAYSDYNEWQYNESGSGKKYIEFTSYEGQ